MKPPHHRLEQRKVRFDFADTPLHWVPGEPEASHIMNSLHLILPAGEFWFCRVYNKALPLVSDPLLAEDVRGFVRQEAQHARAHDSALKPYLERHGLDPTPVTAGIYRLFDKVLCDHPWAKPPEPFPARLVVAPARRPDRRRGAFHLRAGQLDHHHPQPRPGRPGDARPAALARRRRGGAPLRRP